MIKKITKTKKSVKKAVKTKKTVKKVVSSKKPTKKVKKTVKAAKKLPSKIKRPKKVVEVEKVVETTSEEITTEIPTPEKLPDWKIQTVEDLNLHGLREVYDELFFKTFSENSDGEKDLQKLRKKAHDVAHPPYRQALNDRLKEKLGVSIEDLQNVLSKKAIEDAEKLTVQMKNIAPHGDFSKLIENNQEMAEWMKTEGHKPENWAIEEIFDDPNMRLKFLIRLRFSNRAVDEGETIFGTVLLSKNGVVRHSMVQASE